MANRTAKDAKSIKGTNPQYLVEKIIRTRIYDCQYWKEECFGLTSELLVDRAMELDHVGGHFSSNIKPTPFLCLILKMLQIQPSKDIVIEFIKNPDYKYVRALGAMYLRLVGETMECYNYLEPLYNDYRKLKRMKRDGRKSMWEIIAELELIHVDELIDELLHEERSCDIILPRIQKRHILEENEQLEPRVSALDDDLSDVESEEEEEEAEKSPPPRERRSSSSPSHREHHRGREEERGRDRERRRSRSPRATRGDRGRSHSHSPAPHRHRSRSPYHQSSKHTRKRSRSHSPHRHSRGKERSGKSERSRDKESRKSTKSSHTKDKKKSSEKKEENEEVRQANELRAKLGLKPLRT